MLHVFNIRNSEYVDWKNTKVHVPKVVTHTEERLPARDENEVENVKWHFSFCFRENQLWNSSYLISQSIILKTKPGKVSQIFFVLQHNCMFCKYFLFNNI